MDAKAKSFTFLSNEGQITVPFFQRGYVWDKDNWETLLGDLLNTTRGHFLGSLILKQQRAASGEPKEVLVIDGQQRLTTLSGCGLRSAPDYAAKRSRSSGDWS